MKVHQAETTNVLESRGVNSSSVYKFSRTPHMFRMLSSGLYSDKIGAVLREIGCNAYDAHVRLNKKDIPFEVKLPTALDKSFWVKDFGPGLTFDELENNYNNYGWSDKQQKDDEIGGFGLGSKSPFAYTLGTDALSGGFTVEAVKDGYKNICVCHLNNERVPTLSHMGKFETQEHTGLMVSFPVQEADIREFKEKARKIFCWFSTKPIVHGLDTDIEDPEFRMTGSFYKVGALDSTWSRPAVVMGNVRYPIAEEQLKNLRPAHTALLRSGVHLWLPIGSVQMTPSREQLEYVDSTRKVVTEKLNEACLDLGKKIRDSVQQPAGKRYWDWAKEMRTFYESLPNPIQLALKDFLLIAGEPADSADVIATTCSTARARLPKWVGSQSRGSSLAAEADAEFYAKPVRAWYYFYSRSTETARRKEIYRGEVQESRNKNSELTFSYTSDIAVVYAKGKHATAKIKKHVESTGQQLILFQALDKSLENEAMRCAEHLAKTRPFEGVPLMSTEELTVQITPRKRLSAKAPAVTLRSHFAAQPIAVCTLDAPTAKEIVMGNLPSEGVYYLSGYDAQKAPHSRRFYNKDELHTIGYAGSRHRAFCESLMKLSAIRDFSVKSIVLVRTESDAKKLRLAEQGIKPLLFAVNNELKIINRELQLQQFELLPELVGKSMKTDFTAAYSVTSAGWPGLMAYLEQTAPEKVQRLRETFEGLPFMDELFAFLSNLERQRTAKEDEVQNVLQNLKYCLEGACMVESIAEVDSSALGYHFARRHPKLQCLNFEKMFELARSNVDFEKFVAFLQLIATQFYGWQGTVAPVNEPFQLRAVV